jgi:hypothetical protein
MSAIRVAERQFNGRTMKTEADDNTLMLVDFGGGLICVVYGAAAGGIRHALDFSGSYFGTRGTISGLHLNGNPFEYPRRVIAVGTSAVAPTRAEVEMNDITTLGSALRHSRATRVCRHHATC